MDNYCNRIVRFIPHIQIWCTGFILKVTSGSANGAVVRRGRWCGPTCNSGSPSPGSQSEEERSSWILFLLLVRRFTRSALIKLAFSRRSEVEGNEEQEKFAVTFVSEESVSRCPQGREPLSVRVLLLLLADHLLELDKRNQRSSVCCLVNNTTPTR